MIVVPYAGARDMAIDLASRWTSQLLEVRLYKNDYSPTLDSLLADFEEASFIGYNRAVPALWSFVGIQNETHRVIRALVGPFVATAPINPPQRIFGYHVYHVQTGVVLWAERLPYRFFMRGPDTPLNLKISVGLLSEFSG